MIQSAFLSSFIAQLCLAVLAVAAPIADKASPTTDNENAWQFGHGGGILGIIVLILDIIVIIEVLKSNRRSASKFLWILVVFFFPIVGMLIYWLFSNRTTHNRSSGYEPVP